MSLAVDAVPRCDRPAHQGHDIEEGPQRQLVIGPGVLRLRSRDFARAERTWERQVSTHGVEIDALVAAAAEEYERTWEMGWSVEHDDHGAQYLDIPPHPEMPPAPTGRPRAPITSWSDKSQANMQEQFASLDYVTMFGRYRTCTARWRTPGGRPMRCSTVYSWERDTCPKCGSQEALVLDKTPRLPVIATLTYSGDWLRVARCSGEVKQHHANLMKRFERTWGEPYVCIWKQEFQRREAPHFHDFLTPPPGRVLLEVTDRTAAALADSSSGVARKLTARGHVRLTDQAGVVDVDFEGWLSIAWPEVVDHPDDGEYRRHLMAGTGVDRFKSLDLRDPRRVAAYFAGYSRSKDKSYQNAAPTAWLDGNIECAGCAEVYLAELGECPECGCRESNGGVLAGGPGRYWGYRALSKATVAVDVDHHTATWAARVLRRWHRAERSSRARAAAAARAAEVRQHGGSEQEAAAAADAAVRAKLTRTVRRDRARRGCGRIEVTNYEWREVTVVDMAVYRDTLGTPLEAAHGEDQRLVRHEVHDVLGVAGAQLLGAYSPQRRRTRVRRSPITADGRGRALMNDAPAFAAKLGDWLAGRGPDAETRAERLRSTRAGARPSCAGIPVAVPRNQDDSVLYAST